MKRPRLLIEEWLPAMVDGGEVEAVTQVRKLTLSAAFEAHPELFVQRTPRPPVVPEAA